MDLQWTVAQENPQSLMEVGFLIIVPSASSDGEGGLSRCAYPRLPSQGKQGCKWKTAFGGRKPTGWQPWHFWEVKGGAQRCQQWPSRRDPGEESPERLPDNAESGVVGLLSGQIRQLIPRFFFLGNEQMKVENFQSAVSFYGKAIELNPSNAVYYCNR